MNNNKHTCRFAKVCRSILSFFGEIFGELIFYIIAFVIGLGIVWLFHIDFKDMDSESIVIWITLIGFILIGIVALAVHWVRKACKKQKNDHSCTDSVSFDENVNS